MASAILVGSGGGGTNSSDVTATKANVLAGTTTVTSDSGDAVVAGTMTNNGAVSHSLAINGTYAIPAGYHNGSGKVTQSISTKGAATYYATTSDQTIAAGKYLTGNQVIKALSQTNFAAANIKNGVNIKISNGNTNVFNATGTFYGDRSLINVIAIRGFGESSAYWVSGEEQSFTMPRKGTVCYGGFSACYNGSGNVVCAIYVNDVLKDSRNIDSNNTYTWRSTMVNKSLAVNSGDVVKIVASATSGSHAVAFMQAVCCY